MEPIESFRKVPRVEESWPLTHSQWRPVVALRKLSLFFPESFRCLHMQAQEGCMNVMKTKGKRKWAIV